MKWTDESCILQGDRGVVNSLTPMDIPKGFDWNLRDISLKKLVSLALRGGWLTFPVRFKRVFSCSDRLQMGSGDEGRNMTKRVPSHANEKHTSYKVIVIHLSPSCGFEGWHWGLAPRYAGLPHLLEAVYKFMAGRRIKKNTAFFAVRERIFLPNDNLPYEVHHSIYSM